MKEKSLELERLVFFSDAIVAIAMTILVFDLKINTATVAHFTFADLGNSWQKFVAFILSFIIIAIFWKIHHESDGYSRRISGIFKPEIGMAGTRLAMIASARMAMALTT